jgi:hypothetical protein
MSISI